MIVTKEQIRDIYKESSSYFETAHTLGVSKQRVWTVINNYKPVNKNEKARSKLRYAVKIGKIIKPIQCEGCNIPYPHNLLHGHHSDYAKPLEVNWLCVRCHIKAHNGIY